VTVGRTFLSELTSLAGLKTPCHTKGLKTLGWRFLGWQAPACHSERELASGVWTFVASECYVTVLFVASECYVTVLFVASECYDTEGSFPKTPQPKRGGSGVAVSGVASSCLPPRLPCLPFLLFVRLPYTGRTPVIQSYEYCMGGS